MMRDFAREFWSRRAEETTASIRWTSDEMLSHDLQLVGEYVTEGSSLLDLGCGTGDLFLPFLPRLSHVKAVDMIAAFLERIPDDSRITKWAGSIVDHSPSRAFDLGVMFGVVTHLTLDEEERCYRILRSAVPRGGVVIVKNQCGREREEIVDTESSDLHGRYVGRYPHVEAQAARLRELFDDVVTVPYPDELNKWPNTMHAAFVCR
jgi:SAM-dependent methyltransferase